MNYRYIQNPIRVIAISYRKNSTVLCKPIFLRDKLKSFFFTDKFNRVFFMNLREKGIAHHFSDVRHDEIEANGMNIFYYIIYIVLQYCNDQPMQIAN